MFKNTDFCQFFDLDPSLAIQFELESYFSIKRPLIHTFCHNFVFLHINYSLKKVINKQKSPFFYRNKFTFLFFKKTFFHLQVMKMAEDMLKKWVWILMKLSLLCLAYILAHRVKYMPRMVQQSELPMPAMTDVGMKLNQLGSICAITYVKWSISPSMSVNLKPTSSQMTWGSTSEVTICTA